MDAETKKIYDDLLAGARASRPSKLVTVQLDQLLKVLEAYSENNESESRPTLDPTPQE